MDIVRWYLLLVKRKIYLAVSAQGLERDQPLEWGQVSAGRDEICQTRSALRRI